MPLVQQQKCVFPFNQRLFSHFLFILPSFIHIHNYHLYIHSHYNHYPTLHQAHMLDFLILFDVVNDICLTQGNTFILIFYSTTQILNTILFTFCLPFCCGNSHYGIIYRVLYPQILATFYRINMYN